MSGRILSTDRVFRVQNSVFKFHTIVVDEKQLMFFRVEKAPFTPTDKFLHGQQLARFHLAFTRDRWNWTNI